MKTEEFNEVVKKQLGRCESILVKKAEEYATEDRLHNFKVAAKIENCSPEQALMGMMAKHTVSVYDMLNSGKEYSSQMWDEKITDSINYLILLRALIEEKKEEKPIMRALCL